jgi:hypothetical protein
MYMGVYTLSYLRIDCAHSHVNLVLQEFLCGHLSHIGYASAVIVAEGVVGIGLHQYVYDIIVENTHPFRCLVVTNHHECFHWMWRGGGEGVGGGWWWVVVAVVVAVVGGGGGGGWWWRRRRRWWVVVGGGARRWWVVGGRGVGGGSGGEVM